MADHDPSISRLAGETVRAGPASGPLPLVMAQRWEALQNGRRGEAALRCAGGASGEPRIIYAGNASRALAATDRGEHWETGRAP